MCAGPTESDSSAEDVAVENVRLRLALEAAQLGVFEYCLADQRVVWLNESSFDIHGWPRGTNPTLGQVWNEIILREDVETLSRAFESSVTAHARLDVSYRIRRRSDGAVRYLHSLGEWTGADGRERLVGVTLDVTERTLGEQTLHQALQDSERRTGILQSVMDHVPEGITVAFGEDAVIHSVSRHGIALTERDAARLQGIGASAHPQAWQVFHPGSHALATADELPLTRACRGEVVEGEEWRLMSATGRLVPILCNAGPIRDGEGRVIGGIIAWRDITALKQAEAERRELLERERLAREEAEEANRTKDLFLARLSHELRTPLNAVLGWARIAEANASDAAQVVRAAQVIQRNARLQAALVDDLLDQSRILAGRFTFDARRIELAPVVLAAIDTVTPQAQTRSVRIEADLAPGLWLDGDAMRLQQATLNLLSNAVKFSEVGATVRVALERVGARLVLSVADTGHGLTSTSLEHIFRPFWQAEESRTNEHGGLGLGLSIVKAIVASHGGSASVASPGLGRGTTFTVELPAAEGEPHPGGPEMD